jgi:hypothetical protein
MLEKDIGTVSILFRPAEGIHRDKILAFRLSIIKTNGSFWKTALARHRKITRCLIPTNHGEVVGEKKSLFRS